MTSADARKTVFDIEDSIRDKSAKIEKETKKKLTAEKANVIWNALSTDPSYSPLEDLAKPENKILWEPGPNGGKSVAAQIQLHYGSVKRQIQAESRRDQREAAAISRMHHMEVTATQLNMPVPETVDEQQAQLATLREAKLPEVKVQRIQAYYNATNKNRKSENFRRANRLQEAAYQKVLATISNPYSLVDTATGENVGTMVRDRVMGVDTQSQIVTQAKKNFTEKAAALKEEAALTGVPVTVEQFDKARDEALRDAGLVHSSSSGENQGKVRAIRKFLESDDKGAFEE